MKICIIGNGLTSMVLAKNLVKKKIKVDIFYKDFKKVLPSPRTVGITDNNINFLNNAFPKIKQKGFPIKEIKIFNHSNIDKELLSFRSNKIYQMYMFEYHKIFNYILNDIKNLNLLKKVKKNIKDLDLNLISKKYDLVIDTNLDNKLSKKSFYKKIKKNYFSRAFVTIIRHQKLENNNIAKQIFTKHGPIAYLPLSNTRTSIVITLKKNENKYNKEQIKNIITSYSKVYKILDYSSIESFSLELSLIKKYYYKNILAFGDKLHKIHPLAGQGFNMNIRDINFLIKEIDQKINLGLLLDESTLKSFENNRKSSNIIFATGIDLIYEFFLIESKAPNFLSTKLFDFLKNTKLISKYSSVLANKGL